MPLERELIQNVELTIMLHVGTKHMSVQVPIC